MPGSTCVLRMTNHRMQLLSVACLRALNPVSDKAAHPCLCFCQGDKVLLLTLMITACCCGHKLLSNTNSVMLSARCQFIDILSQPGTSELPLLLLLL